MANRTLRRLESQMFRVAIERFGSRSVRREVAALLGVLFLSLVFALAAASDLTGAAQAVALTPVALSVRGVHKSFKRRCVLEDVSFDVRRGEALAVVGENGAGKTTLLRICAGVLRADRGEVARVPQIAYCPQEAGLIEHLNAAEHVDYVAAGLGLGRTDAHMRASGLLRWLHFPEDESAPVRELSTGTRQKLNLALALLTGGPLILLDEPYQGFDRGTYENFWDHVATWRRQGAAVVVVTHMLAELHRVDRVLELHAGGRWVLGTVEEVAA
jgi:ABC-2 type transport system ATP-binding protein